MRRGLKRAHLAVPETVLPSYRGAFSRPLCANPPTRTPPPLSGSAEKRLFYDANENTPSPARQIPRDVTTPRLRAGSRARHARGKKREGGSGRQSIRHRICTRQTGCLRRRRASDTRDTLFEMLLGSFRSSQQRDGDALAAAPRRSMLTLRMREGCTHAVARGVRINRARSRPMRCGTAGAPKR